MARMTVSAACLALVFGWLAMGNAQQPENVRTLMRLKLSHQQGVMEGIALEDFDKIQKNAQSLALVSQAAAWQVFQTPEYTQKSAEFRRTCDDLAKHAKEKNLDAAALDYVKLTLNCVDCHKYVRGVRLGSLNDLDDYARVAHVR